MVLLTKLQGRFRRLLSRNRGLCFKLKLSFPLFFSSLFTRPEKWSNDVKSYGVMNSGTQSKGWSRCSTLFNVSWWRTEEHMNTSPGCMHKTLHQDLINVFWVDFNELWRIWTLVFVGKAENLKNCCSKISVLKTTGENLFQTCYMNG